MGAGECQCRHPCGALVMASNKTPPLPKKVRKNNRLTAPKRNQISRHHGNVNPTGNHDSVSRFTRFCDLTPPGKRGTHVDLQTLPNGDMEGASVQTHQAQRKAVKAVFFSVDGTFAAPVIALITSRTEGSPDGNTLRPVTECRQYLCRTIYRPIPK